MSGTKRSKSDATDSSPETSLPKRTVYEGKGGNIYRSTLTLKSVNSKSTSDSNMSNISEAPLKLEDIKPAFDDDTPPWARQMWLMVKQSAININSMSTSLKMLESKIDIAHSTAKKAIKQVEICEKDIRYLREENEKLKEKVRDAEAYSKKYNLIMLNIPETPNETFSVLRRKIDGILKKMDLGGIDDFYIDNAHRLPQPSGREGPRPVIIKFVSYLDRDLVWNAKGKLKQNGSDVFVKEHFPAEIEAELRQLMPIRRAAINAGHRVKLVNEKAKLVIDSQAYTVKTLHRLPDSLKPENVAVRVLNGHTFFFTGAVPLSNFWYGPYTVDGETYINGEQYLQSSKAVLFKDFDTQRLIMAATSPHVMHELGKKVKNFNQSRWRESAQDIVLHGLLEKFSQVEAAKKFLLNTGTTQLVEAAKNDSFWGIGVHLRDPDIFEKKEEWGSNILGRILMMVRQRLTGMQRAQGISSTLV